MGGNRQRKSTVETKVRALWENLPRTHRRGALVKILLLATGWLAGVCLFTYLLAKFALSGKAIVYGIALGLAAIVCVGCVFTVKIIEDKNPGEVNDGDR